jgi:preprotein translocase subunit SecD
LGFALSGLLVWLALLLKFPIFWSAPITLTLPGIAGFILSIGMAVDANVLIFERYKEEMRNGREAGKALDIGFKRAWPSIRDGNWSTILTCAVLFMFSTGMVKGFAVALTLGVLVSMFSAIVVSRSLLELIPEKLLEKSWLAGVKRNVKK